ncbi:universal stress protein [Halocatena marina]|uniref:Universal stress protein n=1 Tax=Halocatena marina TaxID=2934937 RepID=A0ABD5YV83_9EURY|nr:universal stress protein [Halocatena marina]
MYHEILIPIDSRGTAGPIARAFDLARMCDGTVHVLHVIDTSPEPDALDSDERDALRRHSEKRGRSATVRVQELAAELGLKTKREVREGVPYQSVLAYAEENAIDVIVMGTRAHDQAGTQQSRVGSTTERVVTLAGVPVLTTRPTEENDSDSDRDRAVDSNLAAVETATSVDDGLYEQIVIPTDGSDIAERAAEQGFALAERYGAEAHVVYVIDTRTYGLEDAPRSIVGLLKKGGTTAVDSIAAKARDREISVTTEIRQGVPEEELLRYMQGVAADLTVMGTRGKDAGDDRLLGSTTIRMIRRSETPVLTVS